MDPQTLDRRPVAGVAARICGGLAIAIGVVHIALTGRDFDLHSLDALWFAGSGLAWC